MGKVGNSEQCVVVSHHILQVKLHYLYTKV